MEIMKIVRMRRNGRMPELPAYQSAGAAAMDLRAFLEEPVTLPPHGRALIPTGLAIAVPWGMAGLVLARSGLSVRQGVSMANGVGLIDSDYRGELLVPVLNTSDREHVIEDGDRIAQLMLVPAPPFALVECEALDETDRGEGGFGSTGVE